MEVKPMTDKLWKARLTETKREAGDQKKQVEKEGNMYKLRRIDLAAIGGVRNERGDKRETGRDGRKLGAAE